MMYYEDSKNAMPFVAGLLIGIVAGVGIGLLAAPASGKRTRRKMLQRVVQARDKAGTRVDDWADDLRSALKPIRRQFR
jgi:gas vesicle protein